MLARRILATIEGSKESSVQYASASRIPNTAGVDTIPFTLHRFRSAKGMSFTQSYQDDHRRIRASHKSFI